MQGTSMTGDKSASFHPVILFVAGQKVSDTTITCKMATCKMATCKMATCKMATCKMAERHGTSQDPHEGGRALDNSLPATSRPSSRRCISAAWPSGNTPSIGTLTIVVLSVSEGPHRRLPRA
jgi:hypothetical protein